MVSHWQFRNMCEHCVRGKAKSGDYKRAHRESEIPIMGIDYMWMTSEGEAGEELEHRGRPILVSIEGKSGWLGAWVIPENWARWHAIKVLVGHLEDLGTTQGNYEE